MKEVAFAKSVMTALLAVLGQFEAMAGDIVYVKASGSNTAPYDSEATAATTLDVAVDYAHANGIGKVKIVGTVDQTSQIALDNIEIFGDGWNSANLNLSKNDTTTGYVIGENVLIHGLKMTASDTYVNKIRALYSMSDASSVISNCWFSALKANTLTIDSELLGHVTAGLITHCLFSGCKSNNGGPGLPQQVTHGMGLLSLSGTARMANSIFTGNWQNSNVRSPCDGVLSISGTAKMENCVVYGNYTKATAAGDSDQYGSRLRRGGGIIVTGGSPEIRNCIVRNNKYPATPSDGNYPTETSEDIYSATLEGDFYIVPGATSVIENCNVPEGQVPSGAVNCQTSDPLFAAPGNADFHVAANSPCVDAGKFAAWHNTATDYSGTSARYQGEGVDIGAYEVTKSPTPLKAYIEVEGLTSGAEKYAMVSLSAQVAGGVVEENDRFSWYTSDPRVGSPAAFAVGRVVEHRFTVGKWTVYLKVRDAMGEGQDIVVSLPDAIVINPGADYYVKSDGDDTATGDIDAPFKTITNAVARANAAGGMRKIKVIGTVSDLAEYKAVQVTLTNIELYGDSRTESVVLTSGDGRYEIEVGANSFVHDLKITGSRSSRGAIQTTDESAVVSNCWIASNFYTTGGNSAGVFSAGLVTHCLFTGNYNNNSGGTVMTVCGTAKMRNCVFTGNEIKGNSQGPLNGIVTLADTAKIDNCVFYKNKVKVTNEGYSAQPCGGIYVSGRSPMLRNCVVRENKATMSDEATTVEGDIYVASGTPTIMNCNFPIGQVPAGAVNCQTGDPLFADPDNATAESRDFRIAGGSPCRNAGVNLGWHASATDYTGVEARRQEDQTDIGAYEYPGGLMGGGLMILFF